MLNEGVRNMSDHPVRWGGGKTVSLYGLNVLGLILEDPSSDIDYLNQTGGLCCHQNFATGVFVFVDDMGQRLHDVIASYMTNNEGLSVEDADFLDAAFAKNYAEYLSVDRTKLEYSEEAWVHVRIDPDKETESYAGISAETGILTWDNSD
jgi:hypothetical protein